jgi:hypothetical protein
MTPPELMNHYRQMVLGGLSSAKTPGDYARLLTRIYADFAQQLELQTTLTSFVKRGVFTVVTSRWMFTLTKPCF